jgi:phage terminase small subunit
MPALRDPRHEAFAQARAKGALLIDAYESAGFVRHRGHPSRLALKLDVAHRIAELRADSPPAPCALPKTSSPAPR